MFSFMLLLFPHGMIITFTLMYFIYTIWNKKNLKPYIKNRCLKALLSYTFASLIFLLISGVIMAIQYFPKVDLLYFF